jgi:hypothetical protein
MRLRHALLLLGAVLGSLAGHAAAQAPAAFTVTPGSEHRVALVIGNSAYQAGAALANPVNDARAMAAKLRALGFDVISVENGNQQAMRRAIGQFSGRLGANAVSLFYYAGHGVQVNGHNYLVPVDAEISSEQTVRLETIDVDAVIDQMAMAKSRINLVILDACRNNPYERRFRSVSGGLASIEAPTGTLIAYATSPGKVAADGDRGNGLYTSELLSAIELPGAKVEDVFKRVRAHVVERSHGEQTPWESSSLTGDFYFAGAPAAASAAAPPAPPTTAAGGADRDVVFWTSVKDSRNPALLQAYLDQFPQGTFASLARIMIADLQRTAAVAPAAAAVPPPAVAVAPPPPVAASPPPAPPPPVAASPPPAPPAPSPAPAPPPAATAAPPPQTALAVPPAETLDGRWAGKSATYQIAIEIRQRRFTGTMTCGGETFRMKGEIDAGNKIKGDVTITSMLKLLGGQFPRMLIYAGGPSGVRQCSDGDTVALSRAD